GYLNRHSGLARTQSQARSHRPLRDGKGRDLTHGAARGGTFRRPNLNGESESMRRIVVLLLAALVAVSLAPVVSAQEEDDQVTLRVGLTQDWETLNPTLGFAVTEYEVWNVHYATLTDKAAADFETTPGLAESWTESDDGLTFTYTLREGLLWSDGEPLTSEDRK